MAHLILKEIEQEPFSVDNLIENLTYKTTDGRVGQDDFDPLVLENIFTRTIADLKLINEKSKQKIELLQSECQKEKSACKEKIVELEELYKNSYEHMAKLDKRIGVVSSTMSEMGSQLENMNKPRTNLYESHKTAKYFDKLMEGIPNSGIFADDSKLEQAADVIYKLHLLSNDLNDEKFDKANYLIEMKYEDIEGKLTQSFHQAFFRNDKKSMKKYIGILSNFRNYQVCINEFIKNCQANISQSKDIFADLLTVCKKTNEIIGEVFSNNDRVMEQFVKDLFLGKVQQYVNANIESYRETDVEKYLDSIYIYYNKTKKIFKELSDIMSMSSDSNFFTKLLNDVYMVHLRDYSNLEKTQLQNKFRIQLERFFEQIGHTKRNMQSGFVSNLLSKSNPNEVIDEKFLSHDIATLSIDDAKKSIMRCLLLCDQNSQAKLIEDIYEIICYHLFRDHLYYALDLHITTLQSIDTKQEVKLVIFPVINILNNLIYLFEQFINANVLPPIASTVSYSKIINKQKQICTELESRVDNALDKAFVAICNHLKYILQVEQKKSDFKSENMLENQSTPACTKVVHRIELHIGEINKCLDGRNVSNALKELGIKFHRTIYDHLFRFEYNDMGAMALIRDINEYRMCAKNFNSPIVDKLFNVLHSLTNLLVVKPSNLPEICAGENLASLSKETLESFVQLRSDYKSMKFPIRTI